jgi:hypothetical protein
MKVRPLRFDLSGTLWHDRPTMTIGSTPAIVNAVVESLKHVGVRHLDMPLRAERVGRALHQETKR